MIDEPKNNPRSRMRTLLGTPPESGGEAEPETKASPLTRLPKKAESASFMPKADDVTPPPAQKKSADQIKPQPASPSKRRRFSFGPPFWTITGILSLIVNGILIAVLVVLYLNFRTLYLNLRTLNLDNLMTMPAGLLSGLHTNFEKMDRAHIKTNIEVKADIPVQFNIELNQQTNVVLSQDVRIDNARVTVNTGGLNISNALTTIVLPAGTSLPIVLNLTVPVDKSVPVTLNVPVDIALSQTDLHEPFVGLQEVVQPLYCLVVPSAKNLDGQVICNPAQ